MDDASVEGDQDRGEEDREGHLQALHKLLDGLGQPGHDEETARRIEENGPVLAEGDLGGFKGLPQ